MKVKYTYDRKRRSVTVSEARVYLSDESAHYGGGSDNFNHPRLHLRATGSCIAVVELRYQRDIPAHADQSGANGRGEVTWAKTSGRWSPCYGGRVNLSYEVHTHDIIDQPFRLSHEDTMRVAVARYLARLDSERCRRIYEQRKVGPHTSSGNQSTVQVERDTLERHVATLREAGVPVVAMAFSGANHQRLVRLELPAEQCKVEARESDLEVY